MRCTLSRVSPLALCLVLCVALCMVLCVASAATLAAQSSAPSFGQTGSGQASFGQAGSMPVNQAPDADSGMSDRVEGLFIPLISGQPFHATFAVQIHRHLPDGTVVDQKYYTLVARDSTGRTRREAREPIAADSDLDP